MGTISISKFYRIYRLLFIVSLIHLFKTDVDFGTSTVDNAKHWKRKVYEYFRLVSVCIIVQWLLSILRLLKVSQHKLYYLSIPIKEVL